MRQDPYRLSIGFTGSRSGMTVEQLDYLTRWIKGTARGRQEYFHHGDCLGSDEQFHSLVRAYAAQGGYITVHPATGNARAFCTGDQCYEAEEPLARNLRIVRQADLLIATPDSEYEKLRSGTWATIRAARYSNRPILIVLPDGTAIQDGQPYPTREFGNWIT